MPMRKAWNHGMTSSASAASDYGYRIDLGTQRLTARCSVWSSTGRPSTCQRQHSTTGNGTRRKDF
eukprot:scaffold16956_cov40-Prasinocladus_malaysianus.AAC.1